MPKVGSMVSTPVGEAKVNSVNVLKKTVTLWLPEQKQVLEMPAIDLQMQYGLTVRPVELVEEIEAPLKAEPQEQRPPGPPRPGAPAAETVDAAPTADDGERKRRRRGRRGGRSRRREGGGGADGGSAEGGTDSSGPSPAAG
jgi:hypothetical protein